MILLQLHSTTCVESPLWWGLLCLQVPRTRSWACMAMCRQGTCDKGFQDRKEQPLKPIAFTGGLHMHCSMRTVQEGRAVHFLHSTFHSSEIKQHPKLGTWSSWALDYKLSRRNYRRPNDHLSVILPQRRAATSSPFTRRTSSW